MKSRYLITGGTGLLGNAFQNIEKPLGEWIFLSSKDCDLRNEQETKKLFNDIKPDYVFHLAAKVGGLKANMNYMADFYIDNIRINNNVLDAAKEVKVKKLVSVLSTCIFPTNVSYPLTEDQLHNGLPHESNQGYAYAKRMIHIQSLSYRRQYNCNFICAIINNLFGENDNFDLNDSHVLPAIIRKIYEAKLNNQNEVSFWGDGSPKREFTYTKDIAKALVFLLQNYNEPEPINIGNTKEYKIKEVVKIVKKIIDYKGKIIWDETMSNGQLKKPSCNKKFLYLGWKKENYTDFEEGLRNTIEWFKSNYPNNIRGV
jgi:GDP-L-fucose synthase